MGEVSQYFCLFTQLTGIDVVFGEGIDARKPVILSDQFNGFGDAVRSNDWGIMVISEDFQAQEWWLFQNVNKALVEE